MIAGMKALLFGDQPEKSDTAESDELQLAAAALLVEAAVMDGHFEDQERAAMDRVLGSRFGLDAEATEKLIAQAELEVAGSVELYRFTRIIKDRLEPGERNRILEMLWEVACADGSIHEYESGLVRRIAGLLYVSDRESGEARQRVLARLDTNGR